MPIYTPEEYPAVIERIKTKIAQKNIDLRPTVPAGFGRMRRTKSSLATSPLNVSWGTRVLSSWMRGVA